MGVLLVTYMKQNLQFSQIHIRITTIDIQEQKYQIEQIHMISKGPRHTKSLKSLSVRRSRNVNDSFHEEQIIFLFQNGFYFV